MNQADKPLGMKSLMGLTSERIYSKKFLIDEIIKHMSPRDEGSLAKGLPIDYLHDFKTHFKGQFRIRYRGGSDYMERYIRSPYHCIQRYAKSFAIYPKNWVEFRELLKERMEDENE
jgi:hypothetical protein